MEAHKVTEHTHADTSKSAYMHEPMVATNTDKFGDTSAIMNIDKTELNQVFTLTGNKGTASFTTSWGDALRRAQYSRRHQG